MYKWILAIWTTDPSAWSRNSPSHSLNAADIKISSDCMGPLPAADFYLFPAVLCVGVSCTIASSHPASFSQGGPCGVLAAVQGFILKHLLFGGKKGDTKK